MKTIEQYIETEMDGKIGRKRNSPLSALLVLAVGIGMWILLCTTRLSDSMSTACLTVGMITTALGLVLTAMHLSGAMTHFVYLPTHSRMREKRVYVSGADYKDLVEAIDSGNYESLATMRPVVSSNSAIRLLVSCDGECALVQAVRDEGGRFELDTEVGLTTGPSAAGLLHLIK